MKFTLFTLFPKAFDSFLQTSLIGRGIQKKIIDVEIIDIRQFAADKHKSVDDRPYGGGPGMVLRVDVIDRAMRDQKSKIKNQKSKIILLDAAGKRFDQKIAKKLAKYDNIVFLAGHYEGIDERVRKLVDEEISIGDYILTGGELPAMVVIDAVSRMIPGFLGKKESSLEESFGFDAKKVKKIVNYPLSINQLLEYPQYTRPEAYKGMKVPKVLLSGDHKKIAKWRLAQAVKRTKERRPDILTSQ